MNKRERANLIKKNLNSIYPKIRVPLKHNNTFELLIALDYKAVGHTREQIHESRTLPKNVMATVYFYIQKIFQTVIPRNAVMFSQG